MPLPKPPYVGAAYYPEAWPEGTIEEDIARAHELGVNVLRVAEFAWSRMERTEGQYDFGWLHRVCDRLGEAGIGVVMCTPTATPPAWLTRKYPEVLVTTSRGQRLVHGGRRHGCPTSPKYRELSAGIAARMASEFAGDPSVLGWQIDNEFGCHQSGCFCEACRARWPLWLAERYGSLDALNEAWGNELWSQWYTDWAEVPMPQESGAGHHPSLLFRWRNFMSDMYADYCHEQYRVLTEAGCRDVSTDGMPHFHRLDYQEMFGPLDLVQNNCYFPPEQYAGFIGECDWMRPVKKRPYWFTESAVGWTAGGSVGSLYLPRPGSIRARGWLSVALGGEMVCYWLYRQHWSAQEMVHGSLLHAWGEPTPGSEEVARMAGELAKAGEFLRETRVRQPEVALHYHTPSSWVLDHESQVPGLHYDTVFNRSFHTPLVEANVPRDVIFSDASLEGYRLLLSPLMAWLPDKTLEAALRAVEEGMTWVVGPLTSIRSEHATCYRDCALGSLERALPFQVRRRFPAVGIDPGVIWSESSTRGKATLWCEEFIPASDACRPIALYENGPAAGSAAALEIAWGKGKIVVLGFLPDPADSHWLFSVLAGAGVGSTCPASEGIGVVRREGETQSGWIVFDWKGLGGYAHLLSGGTELLTGEYTDGGIHLEPYGVAVVRD